MPCFLVHNSRVGVLENHQFVRLCLAPFLGLVADTDCLSQYRMPHVFLLFKDIGNGGSRPEIRICKALAVVIFGAMDFCVS